MEAQKITPSITERTAELTTKDELEHWRKIVDECKRWDERTNDIHATLDEWELFHRASEAVDNIALSALDKLLAVAEAAQLVVDAGVGVHMIQSVSTAGCCCEICGYLWNEDQPQKHAPGCAYAALETALAALTEVNEAGEIQDVQGHIYDGSE